MAKGRLLLIDDDLQICDLLRDIAESSNYEVSVANNKTQFMDAYETFGPSLIFIDLSLSGNDGIEILRFLSGMRSQASIVILSGCDERIRASSVRLGLSYGLNVKQHLSKPIDVAVIKHLLDVSNPETSTQMADKLAQAITQNDLALYYQPKLDAKTLKLVGVEALVRWIEKDRTVRFPDSFIPLAEESNLIRPLTFWTIESALKQKIAWAKQNYTFSVAINLSASVLNDIAFPEKIENMLEVHKVNPKELCFEVTESVMFHKPEVGLDILTRLAIKGFKISIDDFGTGYSSLIQLHKIPFGEMKIDKSFVINSISDPDCWIIIKSIIDLGHNLKLSVVAEGVENKEVFEGLKKMDCDIVQGYYFSKPIPVQDFDQWIRSALDENLILKNG